MRQHPQLMLEDKGATLALHYRMAPELQRIARQAAEEARQLAGTDHVLLEGKMVIEIKPATTSKSRAIAAFLEEQPFRAARRCSSAMTSRTRRVRVRKSARWIVDPGRRDSGARRDVFAG